MKEFFVQAFSGLLRIKWQKARKRKINKRGEKYETCISAQLQQPQLLTSRGQVVKFRKLLMTRRPNFTRDMTSVEVLHYNSTAAQ